MSKCYITMCDEDGTPWPEFKKIEIPKELFERLMKFKDPSKFLNSILWIDRLEKDVSEDVDKEIKRLERLAELYGDIGKQIREIH